VSVTDVFWSSVTEQPVAAAAPAVMTQRAPPGAVVTTPLPVPAPVIVSETGDRMKAALTDRPSLKLTSHAPEPLHAPPHPENVQPDAGVADSATLAPTVNVALHDPVDASFATMQAIPLGVELIDPDPVPVVVSVAVVPSNRATTPREPLIVSVQLPVPVHEPSHPTKRLAAPGCALSTTVLPSANDALHVFWV
jgi:hypothetical protein